MNQNASTPADELLKLARNYFGQLTSAEEKLFTATANGETANYGEGDPADAKDWPTEQAIKADRLQWLCIDKKASEYILQHAGVSIQGLRIDGRLDLGFITLLFPLGIWQCYILERINFQQARTRSLSLNRTHTGLISADGIKVNGDIHMGDGFKSEGEVRLLDGDIGGNLYCNKGHFINKKGIGVHADGIQPARA